MRALVDHTTTVVALGGVSSPVWLQYLDATSSVAGDLIPILGAVWLVIKIALWLKNGGKE